MGDENNGLADCLLQTKELELKFFAGDWVGCAERFIHEHYRWVCGERTGHANALLLAVRGETYENALKERRKDLFIGAVSLIYAVWLLYAGGTKYLLLSALLYAPGAILFAKAKHELGKPIFTNVEKLIFAAVVIGALVAAYGLYAGFLTM